MKALKSKDCTGLSYRIIPAANTFDVAKFSAAIGSSRESNGWDSVLLESTNPEGADYHAHVYWKKDKLQVDYHTWKPEPGSAHASGNVHAETFFRWVRQFFNVEKVDVHVHADFEYPVGKWQVKILALPLKVPYGDGLAEIEGLSMKLPKSPEGVGNIWMVRGKKTLDIQLYADRQLEFSAFDAESDVDAFVGVVKTLIQEITI